MVTGAFLSPQCWHKHLVFLVLALTATLQGVSQCHPIAQTEKRGLARGRLRTRKASPLRGLGALAAWALGLQLLAGDPGQEPSSRLGFLT